MPSVWTITIRHGLLLVALGYLINCGGSLQAQLPVARLTTVFPPGGKAGTSVEVTISGADLEEADRLLFSHTNISARPKLAENSDKPEPNKFSVTIPADVPPGIYDVRVAGRFGVSNPRAFEVGNLSEAMSPGTNHTVASAAPLTLNTVVNGRADANNVDYFKFTATKGRRVLIRCRTQEIDSRMDAALALFDIGGKELEHGRLGEVLDFNAPADSQYVLKVHDFTYRGSAEYFYRLSAATRPHIDFIFPPSGVAGTKGTFLLYGRNLPESTLVKGITVDGKSLEQLAVEIELPPTSAAHRPVLLNPPPSCAVDGIDYRLASPQGVSNPALLSLATAPVVAEVEPNDKPEQAQKVSLPCELVGQFYPRNDRDWLTFETKKGDVYWLEVFSHRLGLATDPFVLVQRVTKNDKGQENATDVQELYDSDANIGGVEFNTAARDPAWRFEVKEDGIYRIQIRDLFSHAQNDPRLVYRLSLRKERPDFRLVAMPQAPPSPNKDKKEALAWTVFLRRGETAPIKVLALRRDNFGGDIQLVVEGLPAGVKASDTRIESGRNSATLLLTTTDDSADWDGPVRIVGKAKAVEAELVREAVLGTIIWTVDDYNNEAVRSRTARELYLAVSSNDVAPISITSAENRTWETSVAGKLQIPLTVARRGGSNDFRGALKLKPTSVPALDSAKELDIDGKTNSAVLELDLSQQKLAAGAYTFYLQGQTSGKYSKLTAAQARASVVAEEEAKQAEKLATDLSAEGKKAADELAAAIKAVQEAESVAKAASEKLASTKVAAEKEPANEVLVSAVEAAEKGSADADARLKTAEETKEAADKKASEVSARAKEAEIKKAEAANRAKEAKEVVQKSPPKDVTLTVYSEPIALKVAPAPITLSAEAYGGVLEQGSKVEIPVKIVRLYDYADPVELTLSLPKEITGLSSAKVTIPKDQTEAKLAVDAAANATPGDHKLTLQAALKLNNQDIRVDQPISLRVAAKSKPPAQ